MSLDTTLSGLLDVAKPETDDLRLWSVTTIIGALDKAALLYWAAEQTASAACDIAGSLAMRVEEEGREAVVKWLRDARFRRPKDKRSAAELGTDVHAALEHLALTGEFPVVDDEVRPFVEQFDNWAQRWQPEYEAAEVTVYSPTYGYSGTCDGFFRLGGERLIFDYKSSAKSLDSQGKRTGPYPEVALQLAAYRYAEMAATWRPRRYEQFRRRYYLLGEAERAAAVPVPEVDGGVVVHITPEHCDVYPVRCDKEIHTTFLYVLEAARWQFETSKQVIGEPLQLPEA